MPECKLQVVLNNQDIEVPEDSVLAAPYLKSLYKSIPNSGRIRTNIEHKAIRNCQKVCYYPSRAHTKS